MHSTGCHPLLESWQCTAQGVTHSWRAGNTQHGVSPTPGELGMHSTGCHPLLESWECTAQVVTHSWGAGNAQHGVSPTPGELAMHSAGCHPFLGSCQLVPGAELGVALAPGTSCGMAQIPVILRALGSTLHPWQVFPCSRPHLILGVCASCVLHPHLEVPWDPPTPSGVLGCPGLCWGCKESRTYLGKVPPARNGEWELVWLCPESWEGSWERDDGTRDQQNPSREETAWTFREEAGPWHQHFRCRGRRKQVELLFYGSCSMGSDSGHPMGSALWNCDWEGAQGQCCSLGLPLSPSWDRIRIWKGCGAPALLQAWHSWEL
ncbi:uncharacterized protein LOC121358347 [Pyrgilauda ruficollis]|uniref:uncharacterized protein LOC121358347 n=1 Tax=Pyrgilauda ruficollis TaxID=221976 RepID=UPI001B8871D9|nr:uncharacterized protein LOC121358347 [Pyrgilauda ruficollis]